MKFDPTRSTPSGYWRFAAEYALAAQAVQTSVPRAVAPALQLHGQAIELALKSFLLKRGERIEDVEALRHKLTDILRTARSRRLGTVVKLDNEELAIINLLSKSYVKHRFRYIVTGITVVPDINSLSALTEKLVVGLEEYCTGKKWGLGRIARQQT